MSTTAEVWINEGEPGERCFDVEFRVDSDETFSGRIVPEISVIKCFEDGAEVSDEVFNQFKDEIYADLDRIVDGWGDTD